MSDFDPSRTLDQRVGAFPSADGVAYRVWAPDHPSIAVEIQSPEGTRKLALQPDDGFWGTTDPAGRAGDLYRFELTDGNRFPDVASRFQPQGVHGPSECIDPTTYRWRSNSWRRPAWVGQSIYEVHLGTFTPEGTYRAAIDKLGHVRELGAEAIELMPLADFPGRWNWGYDGVGLYAPARCYGRPDDLRALIDAAHEHGLLVILDVVYNHLGPAGNYLSAYARDYFHASHTTPWGAALNLDGPRNEPVRAFLVENAAYWLDEFRFDGLRLDATHAMVDTSATHLLAEIAATVHARGGFVIAEDERNTTDLLRTPHGQGCQIDALWSDDFHHHVRVALTGEREAHFGSYTGTAADLVDTLQHGWSYRGQNFPFWKNRPRGTACDHLPPSAFVYCIENHDQVGNRARGERLEHLIAREAFRAASMLLCLSPYPPLIFMGQEWAASTPFLFFTDHEGELGRIVSAGRRREFEGSSAFLDPANVPDPQDSATFALSRLRWMEVGNAPHSTVLALYRACLRQRRQWRELDGLDRAHWRTEAIGDVIVLRYEIGEVHWLLLVALRASSTVLEAKAPILRAPAGLVWRPVIRSDDVQFGGPTVDGGDPWNFHRPLAILLQAGASPCP